MTVEESGLNVPDQVPAEYERAKRRSSAMAAAAAAAAALYGDDEPSDAAPVELRAEILDSIFRKAANDIIGAIPAQMCVVYTYDRQTNLLSPQIVVCGDETGTSLKQESSQGDAEKTNSTENSEVVTFPPTISMIGACFLQKRCLKMQEPNRHRAFHREYDVPKGIKVDSIICAPVIIRHRAIAVIQLLNRLNPDFAEDASPQAEHPAQSPVKAKDSSGDDFRDIALHRSHSIRPVVKKSFSSKDEQKLIQLASNLSQTAETRLKRVDDQSVTHAKIRELQASNAIALLNILNTRLERRDDENEAIVPIGGLIRDRSSQRTLTVAVPSTLDIPIELIGSLIAIIRLQARFRARRVRRNEKFAEALETFRRQHERVQSIVLLQRVARGALIRKRVKRQRGAVAVLSRVYNHYRARLNYAASREAKRKPRRPTVSHSQNPPPTTASHHFKRRSVLTQESEHVVKTRKSATVIQRQFRGHQTRKIIKQLTGFTNLAKGLRNIVKLQSVVRGGLARIQVKRAKALLQERTMQSPRTVCMRIGMSPNLHSPHEVRPPASTNTAYCVYPLPERRNNAHIVHNRSLASRSRLERGFDDARTNTLRDNVSLVQRDVLGHTLSTGNASPPDLFELESRRLAPAIEISSNSTRKSGTNKIPPDSMQARSTSFPGLVSEIPSKKRTPRPPGVEFACDRSIVGVRQHLNSIQHQRHNSLSNNDSRESVATCSSSVFKVECNTSKDCSRNFTAIDAQSKPGELLARSNQFRREAFRAVMGYHTALPLLTKGKDNKSRGRGNGPLLCCLLPAQAKLGGTFNQMASQRRSSIKSESAGRTGASSVATTQPVDVKVPLQPTEERLD